MMCSENEGNVLFNDTLNTFLVILFGVRHIVKDDHRATSCSENEGNVLFNDALNTFFVILFGVRHTVKDDHKATSRSENGLFNDTLNTF